MRRDLRVIDADAHVVEPTFMWREYIAPEFRERAPVVEDLAFGVFVDGKPINTWDIRGSHLPVETRRAMSARLVEFARELFPEAAVQDFSPAAQLADFNRMGIDKGVLYPSAGLFALADDTLDPRLAAAIATAYNRWLADFCATDPQRLLGAGMIALHDVPSAVAEIENAAKLGMVGIFIRPNPVLGRNLDHPAYEPIWDALEDTNLAIATHEGGQPNLPQLGERFSNGLMKHICSHAMEQMTACMTMVFGGVLKRHPKLRAAFVEAGCGWLPYWLWRMDDHFELSQRTRNQGDGNGLTMLPTEYFKRQCFVSADPDEDTVPYVADLVGEEVILWASDYPHPDAKFPGAVDHFLARPGLSADRQRKILWDNPSRLYALA
jgi:predicted TIM-barrel fold metal-dependent hydrolase